MEEATFYVNLNPINFLIISGIIQGFILVGLLLVKASPQAKAKRFLACALFLTYLHLAQLLLIDTNLEVQYPFLLWLPSSYLTAIAPCIYFYTRILIHPQFTFSKNDYKHFIPVCIEFILCLIT